MPPLVNVAAADAAGPRPFFQMPFACGQTWEASTYDGHWPDQDSVDLGEWTAGDANMSQGEQIGRVGNSGTEAYHLHYTQLQDGKAVRIAFNGALISTHAGQSPYSPWGNGEKLTSLNCPMNSFMQFTHTDGKRYQLAYKPGTGEVDIDRINAGGAGVTGVWGDNWTKGWTHLTPFTHNGKPHYFAYKSATGEVDFNRVNPGGLGVTTIGEGTWSKGWTNFMPFSLGGQPLLHRLQQPLRRSEPRQDQRRRQRRLDAVVGLVSTRGPGRRERRPGSRSLRQRGCLV